MLPFLVSLAIIAALEANLPEPEGYDVSLEPAYEIALASAELVETPDATLAEADADIPDSPASVEDSLAQLRAALAELSAAFAPMDEERLAS